MWRFQTHEVVSAWGDRPASTLKPSLNIAYQYVNATYPINMYNYNFTKFLQNYKYILKDFQGGGVRNYELEEIIYWDRA